MLQIKMYGILHKINWSPVIDQWIYLYVSKIYINKKIGTCLSKEYNIIWIFLGYMIPAVYGYLYSKSVKNTIY